LIFNSLRLGALAVKEKIDLLRQPLQGLGKSLYCTMKTLYLVRHAKSSWDHPGLSDFERPLLSTGIKKTSQIIKYLKKKNVSADLIISSPAVRAFETAKLIASGIEYPAGNIKPEPSLYNSGIDDYLDVIREIPDDINSLMIFGHNLTITHVANLFLDPGIDLLPTSGVVAVTFDTNEWKNISGAKKEQEFVVFPKMLKS
jgi:phosphohistidine phosphatase